MFSIELITIQICDMWLESTLGDQLDYLPYIECYSLKGAILNMLICLPLTLFAFFKIKELVK